ncbi:MAG: hypothetical protein AB9834_03945 [Lentimicrobium sp.]
MRRRIALKGRNITTMSEAKRSPWILKHNGKQRLRDEETKRLSEGERGRERVKGREGIALKGRNITTMSEAKRSPWI